MQYNLKNSSRSLIIFSIANKLKSMSKSYKCPSCQSEVDSAAQLCSNSSCRANLAFCSCCRDICTYEMAEAKESFIKKERFRCNRCQSIGAKCLTWLTGGYCNGLAKTGPTMDRPFCAQCSNQFGDMARNVLGWTLIGLFGSLTRKK